MRRLNIISFRILPLMAVLLAGYAAPAIAAKNYTALPDSALEPHKTGESEDKNGREAEELCTKQDNENIREYAKRLEIFSKKAAEGALKSGEMGENTVLRKDYMKIHDDFTKYLTSDRHEQVKQSYKDCDVEMPTWSLIDSFWPARQ